MGNMNSGSPSAMALLLPNITKHRNDQKRITMRTRRLLITLSYFTMRHPSLINIRNVLIVHFIGKYYRKNQEIPKEKKQQKNCSAPLRVRYWCG